VAHKLILIVEDNLKNLKLVCNTSLGRWVQ